MSGISGPFGDQKAGNGPDQLEQQQIGGGQQMAGVHQDQRRHGQKAHDTAQHMDYRAGDGGAAQGLGAGDGKGGGCQAVLGGQGTGNAFAGILPPGSDRDPPS